VERKFAKKTLAKLRFVKASNQVRIIGLLVPKIKSAQLLYSIVVEKM